MYADANQMRARYGEDVLVQLTDAPAWDATAIAAINVKLTDASALADGYVAKYLAPTPGVGIPPLLVRIVCEIAFCELHRSPTEEARGRKKDAIRQLEQIASGMIKLDEGRGDLPARGGAIIVPDRDRTMSRDGLKGF